jgi:putative hydrolase of the HAD superfamily
VTKAFVFDLGNVVLTGDYPYNTPAEAQEFCDYFGVTLDNASLAFTIAFHDFSLGKCSEDEFWMKYLYTARAKKTDIAYAKSFWRKNQKENEHMISLLAQLKKTYRLAALSTIPKEWLEFKRKTFRLDDCFETIISSGEYGIIKPDPGIYQIVVGKLGLNPSEITFFDDSENLLPPALRLGMKTILFRGQENLTKQLHTLTSRV